MLLIQIPWCSLSCFYPANTNYRDSKDQSLGCEHTFQKTLIYSLHVPTGLHESQNKKE